MRPGIKSSGGYPTIQRISPDVPVKYFRINKLVADELQGQDLYNEDVNLSRARCNRSLQLIVRCLARPLQHIIIVLDLMKCQLERQVDEWGKK